MDEQLSDYRQHLLAAEQKAQEDFDKTIISLSGGALGVSFAFVKDLIGDSPVVYAYLLLVAWLAWGASVTVMLTSYFTSALALRKAISQTDANEIYSQRPGRFCSLLTMCLNILGGVSFAAGVVSMSLFVYFNWG